MEHDTRAQVNCTKLCCLLVHLRSEREREVQEEGEGRVGQTVFRVAFNSQESLQSDLSLATIRWQFVSFVFVWMFQVPATKTVAAQQKPP